ncbi:pseudouridine synthase [Variovorax sp. PvP013]|uniref:pseudouridine synthase n=1 Tax=Variovorax sp. PvP013 TaxID=3156435 RepID=UPI003D1F0FA8
MAAPTAPSPPLRPPLPLPTRDGVGPSCVGLPAGDWPTFLDFFLHRFPGVARETWLARFEAAEVVDEHGHRVTADRPYAPHRRVYYYRSLPDEPRVPFEHAVLWRDERLLVVDKPHFLPVAPTGKYLRETLLVRLKRSLGLDDLVPVHRIDRGTAGLVLFAVDPATRGAYQGLFAERRVRKTYEALVHWPDGTVLPAVRRSRLAVDDRAFMKTREVDGEPNSETHFELIETIDLARSPASAGALALATPSLADPSVPRPGATVARLRLSPVTGRRHQLRVHCAALGIPIVDDPIYPVLRPETDREDFARPLRLLARSLAFTDPVTGEAREFRSRRSLDDDVQGL